MQCHRNSQANAAKLTGIAQPDLSNLLHGKFPGFSIERLLLMLTAFGRDVELVVR
jgi:predicted XRE-type DNA-binding protein